MKRIAWNKGITKVKSKPCLCGCGEMLPVHIYPRKDGLFNFQVFKFIKGHEKRGINGFDSSIHNPKLCACGCGKFTNKIGGKYYQFIKGHENIGRSPWNKDVPFSKEVRLKMSIARLGKEPANKTLINEDNLYRLYVSQRKNISEVSKLLLVSKDTIKNRLQFLGWGRTTKESCNSVAFKNKMRKIRVQAIAQQGRLGSPNKLEDLVYKVIDTYKVSYQKQVPLFDKFVVDALFPNKKLVLEIFGKYWHELPNIKKKDISKKKYLEKCGYQVEEIWDYEIKKYGPTPLLNKIFLKYNII